MSETRLLTLDLHRLQNSDLLPSNSDVIMLADLERATGVVPLELSSLRKTTRRLAALLNNPEAAGSFLVHKTRKRIPPNFCHVCRALAERNRHLGKCHHVFLPPAPYPTFIGDGTMSARDASDDEGGLAGYGAFDTSVLRSLDERDVNEFSLPPTFNGASKKQDRRMRRQRVVPTVSENTFVTSNIKDLSKSADFALDDVTRFPEIGTGRDLVSQSLVSSYDIGELEGSGTGDPTKRKSRRERIRTRKRRDPSLGPDDDLDLDAEEVTEDDETGETTDRPAGSRQRTGASLHIDEDYEPMKVTIKKLTETDIEGRGFSDYQEFTEMLSDASLGVSRENTLDSYSPSFIARVRESTFCDCDPSDLARFPCRECQKYKGHETWCVSAGSVCQLCTKPTKVTVQGKRRASVKPGDTPTNTNLSPDTALTTRKITSVHSQRSCPSSRDNDSRLKKRDKNKGKPTEGDQRVRFSDTVQQVSPDNRKRLPKTALDYSNLDKYDHVTGDDDDVSQWADKVEVLPDDDSSSKTKKQKRAKSLADFRIPELGVNIHRAAYILALKDARLGLTTKKKKKGSKKGAGMDSTRSEPGTIFSYFPLLPQPKGSPSAKEMPFGLRQNEGAKVKLKDAMKHIFGKVKWDDYYPGGKRWKKMV